VSLKPSNENFVRVYQKKAYCIAMLLSHDGRLDVQPEQVLSRWPTAVKNPTKPGKYLKDI
jgi:hypothetical protein